MNGKNWILAATALLFLVNCGGDSPPPPPAELTPQELYEIATTGNKQEKEKAEQELLSRTGTDAGLYQEKLADDLQWKDSDQAEVLWAAAKKNGVQDGGPEYPVFYWMYRHWILTLVCVAILIFAIYIASACAGAPQKKPTRKRTFAKNSILIIDTNIWMDEAMSPLIHMLRNQAAEADWKIHVEQIVVGELKGLSNNPEKQQAARMGMRRIEGLQEALGSHRVFITNNAGPKDKIADSVLLRVAANTHKAVLITNDRELRILAINQSVKAPNPRKLI